MDLDPVREEFVSDVGPWLDGLELAIASTKDFRDEVVALHAAIDTLPLERTVRVNFETNGMPQDLADTSAWDAQSAAIHAAEQALYDDALAQETDRAATDANTAAALDNAKATFLLASAERMQAKTAREQAAATGTATASTFDATAATLASIDATLALARSEQILDDAAKVISGDMEEVAAKTDTATSAARRGYGVWGLLTRDYTLWAGVFGDTALIGKVAGWHVVLDGVLESAVALGEGLAALSVGIAAMVPASQDIYTHLKSVSTVSSALDVTIPPLTGKFETLAEAMAPQTVEAYGGALGLVNQNGHTLATVAGEVVTGIDDLVARLDLWASSQNSTGKLLQDGVGFLHQFEEALGNVAAAVGNLIRSDPGTAHYLMDFVVLGTKALDVITQMPAPLLEAALALHSFDIWGGLAATQVVKLLNPLRSLAVAMGGVAAEETALSGLSKDATGLQVLKATLADVGTGFATWGRGIGTAVTEAEGLGKVGAGLGAAFSFVNPVAVGLTALAAGVGYVVYEMLQASQASQQFAASANQALGRDSATQYLATYPALAAQGLQGLSQALHDNERAWVPLHDAMSATGEDFKRAIGFNHGLMDGLSGLGDIFRDGAKAVGDFATGMVHGQQAMNSVNNYTGALAHLNQGQKNLLHDADALIGKGHSVADSFALLDLAGVKAGDSFQLAGRKVENLLKGYRDLAAGGPALMGNINAVTFASEQQDSKISALTQAWTGFISTVTGGESAFTSFAQQVQGVATAASTSANSLSVSNGKVSDTTKAAAAAADAAKVSIDGLSSASLQLRGSFTQAITQGSTLLNSLQTMASAAGLGARGVHMLNTAGRDMVAELLPMTQHSKAAVAELYALAQQAGYHGADSFKALAEWVGNVRDPMKNLDSITAQLTADSANLTQDVKNLADAIGQNLNQAMAQALLQANGGQKAFDQFATAMSNSRETAAGLHTAAQNLAEKLLQVEGTTKAAHAEFDVMASAMGLSTGKADALWASIESGASKAAASVRANVNGIINALNSIPSQKTISIIERATVLGGGGGGPSGAGNPFTRGMASGGKVPGSGHGDVVPAMLEPGEAIVPKHLVGAIAPFLSAHHVPGFAAGGVVHGGGGSGAAEGMQLVAEQWAKELMRMDIHRFGRMSPIRLKEMEALLHQQRPGGVPDSPLGKMLGLDVRSGLIPYGMDDIQYWKTLDARHHLSETERHQIQKMEKELARDRANDSLREAARLQAQHTRMEDHWWKLTRELSAAEKAGNTGEAHQILAQRTVLNTAENKIDNHLRAIMRNHAQAMALEKQIPHLEHADALKFRQFTAAADLLLFEMGYQKARFPAGVYDRGGYLPVGLSMAYNGTGRPEPVGAAAGPRSAQPLHVHLVMDGQKIATAIVPDLVAAVADYNYLNSGQPTGKLIPGR